MISNYRVAIITLSDKASIGEREDTSGPKIQEIVKKHGYEVVRAQILSDDMEPLEQELKSLADGDLCDLILTTGGTGLSPRDHAPEATLHVIDREVPGIAEAIRAYSMTITKRAMLSRAVSGIRGNTLIINLPGSKKAVEECLSYLIDTLDHGLAILRGKDGECARKE